MNRTDVAKIWQTDAAIYVELHDGRRGKELFADYSRLAKASQTEREAYEMSYFGLHWPALDEDLSFDGFFNK